MKSFKAQFSVAVVFMVLGIMLSYQFESAKGAAAKTQERRFDVLSQQIKDVENEKVDLEKYIAECEKKIEEYEKNASSTDGLANSLKSELERVRTLAGLINVDGSGIVITMTPGEMMLDNKPPAMEDTYLLAMLNELNACGAEAISINDQRIVSTTQIRGASGRFIIINDVKQSTSEPFVIKAIGNPQVLEGGISMAGGIKQMIEFYGINVDVKRQNNLSIQKYNGLYEFKYAKPSKGVK